MIARLRLNSAHGPRYPGHLLGEPAAAAPPLSPTTLLVRLFAFG